MVARLAVTALSGRLLRARGPSPPLSAWLMTSSRSHLAPTHSSTSCRTDRPRKSTSVGPALLSLTIGSACSATLRSCRPTSPPLAHTTPRARPRSHPHLLLLLLQPPCRPRKTRSRLLKRYVGGHGSESASSPTQSSVDLLRLWHAAVLGLARRPTCPRRANPVRRDTARGFALAGEHS
jgi:hypothetical protein